MVTLRRHHRARMASVTTATRTAAGLLGAAAVAETVIRQAHRAESAQYVLVLCLLGLVATVPVMLPYPAPAALVVTAAGVLSLSAFHALPLACAVTLLVLPYRWHHPGAVLLGLPFLVLTFADRYVPATAPLLAALVPVAAGLGSAQRVRRDDAERRAVEHAIAGTLVEHSLRGERARIARELHDVVAHHISMISVQAENARLTTPGMPAAGAQRLSAIGDTARAALTEMRRLLGVLRSDVPAQPPERRPQPGLRQINELLDETREASGAGARLILRGSPAALDPGVELAAYRIVQEALTNTRRHAPGAAVDVELHYTGAALRVLVRDNGPGPVRGVGGHGLIGMRERAAAVGGRLRTGSGVAGGFVVEAVLPAGADDVP